MIHKLRNGDFLKLEFFNLELLNSSELFLCIKRKMLKFKMP